MNASLTRLLPLGATLASCLTWNAQAVLSPTLNALGRTIHVSTPTNGNQISLQDLQSLITSRADLTTAAVLTGEASDGSATTLTTELANSGTPAKFTFNGPNRYSRNDTAVTLAATSGGRFGLIADNNTWNLGSTGSQGVSHFGAIFYNYLDSARLLNVRATFNDGTTETYTSTATTLQYVFVGFRAPEGKWISSITVTEVTGGGWLGFDDVAIVLAPTPGPSLAWDDQALDGLWSSATNWSSDTGPSDTNTLEFGASTTTTLTNDLIPSPALSSLYFGPSAPSYTFDGEAISPGILIHNNSGKNQTLNTPILLNSHLNITGNGPIDFVGGISGDHSITKNGTSSISLSGPLSFTGTFNLTQGSATISGTQDQFTGNIRTINLNNTTLTIDSGTHLLLPAGSTFQIGNEAAQGTGTATLNLSGTLECQGSSQFLRGSSANISSTATLSGPVLIEGIGGYGANLNVPTTGILHLTSSSPVTMKSGTNDAGRGRLRIQGGQVHTSTRFEGQPTQAFPPQIELSENGTLFFTAPQTQATNGVNLTFGTNGGTIDTSGHDVYLPGSLSGTGSFTKSGGGTLTLDTATLPTGNIIVNSGTLALTAQPLTATTIVELTSNSVLNLQNSGTQRVAELKIDGFPVTPGIYGAPGSGAPTELDQLSGLGRLAVAITDPYDAWISQFTTLTLPADQDKTADPDGDGLPNFAEFAFLTNPEAPNTSTIRRSGFAQVNGTPSFCITLALRSEASFRGPGKLVSDPVDGLIYEIHGSYNLSDFTTPDLTEVTPALTENLPSPPDGWTYRTFTLTNPDSKGFLRASTYLAPTP